MAVHPKWGRPTVVLSHPSWQQPQGLQRTNWKPAKIEHMQNQILHSRKTHYTHLVGECSGFRILRFDKSPFRFFLHFCTLNFVTGYLFPAMTMQNEVIPTATWHDWHLGQQHGTVQHGHIRLLTTCQRYT